MLQGKLALVGSGEYSLEMLEIERALINSGIENGKTGGFVQFATAAGLESTSSLEYWRDLGAKQGERLGVEVKFIEVFSREDAQNAKWIELVENASLIYFSGGNPKHVKDVFSETELWKRIVEEFNSGTSLAGCSAGAMMMGEKIAFPIHIKNMESGLELVPNLIVLPHYDRYFSRIPRIAQKFIFGNKSSQNVIGIDENTALINNGHSWQVLGTGEVHIISADPRLSFSHGDELPYSLISNPN